MKEYSISKKKLTRRILTEYEKSFGAFEKDSSHNLKSFVRSTPIPVSTFNELVMEIAELSYKNPDVMLFYRGQNNNYVKEKYATLYPSIYRVDNFEEACEMLEISAEKLLKELDFANIEKNQLDEVKKIKLLQYSILQHYEVCETPLIDVTQSLKVACSFAVMNNSGNRGYVYILALPYINGRISVNSEQYITNVRLLSISCSDAKRPFFQEGYLVQTEFANDFIFNKGDFDFNRRIVAIYEFENSEDFWEGERPFNEKQLYPNDDRMKDICEKIKKNKYHEYSLEKTTNKNNQNVVEKFLIVWNDIETEILQITKSANLSKGLYKLQESNRLKKEYAKSLKELRDFRNTLVHNTTKISREEIEAQLKIAKETLKEIKSIHL